jgi:hypothetical protein
MRLIYFFILYFLFIAFQAVSQINLQNGLIAYYPFDGNANEVIGNSNSGAVFGAILTSDRFGNANSAYFFDGSSYITVNDFTLPLAQVSYSVWVKASTNAPTIFAQDIISKHQTFADIEVLIRQKTDGRYDAQWNINGTYYPSTDPSNTASQGVFIPRVNCFDLLTLTYDGTQIKFYVNGSLISSVNATRSITTNSLPLSIGRLAGAPGSSYEYYNGTIDDIRIYNRALSDLEIAALYDLPGTLSSGNLFGNDSTLCFGQSIILNPKNYNPNIIYQWSDGSSDSILIVSSPGTYWLNQMESTCNTMVNDSILISFTSCCEPLIPNLVSSNADGLNDYFTISCLTDFQLKIFNRWGEQVYGDYQYANNWNGLNLSDGIYYYLIKDNTSFRTYKGWVHVLH